MRAKGTSIAAAVVVAGVAALVPYKEGTRVEAPTPTTAATTEAEDAPRVVLVADPREAESACGCGEIIRMVRSAGSEGVEVLEVAPGSAESHDYRATVNPTVLFLDSEGKVLTRYEGEEAETISGIREQLDELSPR